MSDYVSQALGDGHHLDAFTCGKESLDNWLKTQARRAHSAGTARTYVWTHPGSPDALAYFSLAPTQVVRADVPAKLAGGFSIVPAYLLARLALDNTLQGQGLGAELLLDALSRIVEAARAGGGRLVVVDAIDDDAAAFYRRHDFTAVTGTSRLYLKIATAETILDKSP